MTNSVAAQALDSEVLRLYEAEERTVEKKEPHQPYKDVLAQSAMAVARKVGWALPKSDTSFLSEALPHWRPFPDTNPALERLAKKHTLGILSNVDNDLLAGTLKHLKARFDIIVTAENVKSYKPELAHFREARRMIGDEPWIHVAGSIYHDIEPAVVLGINAVWVNRKNSVPERRYPRWEMSEVRDLKHFVDLLESGGLFLDAHR